MRKQPRYSKGQRIGGRFLVHQALMGGMGEVYLCLDERNISPVALKTFQGNSPELADIFKREVASWIALEKHPNIVRCFWMEKFDNIPFMVLEWVAGEEGRDTDLRSWLRHGTLDLTLALRFTIDIVRGLQHANQKVPGIVHRDLKPDNVLVNQSRQAKITDFGLALVTQLAKLKAVGSGGEEDMGQSCYVGSIVGTPAYMAPEQWRGEANIDFRTDIYAVGCIFYELLTGKWLYSAHSMSELRARHLEAPIPRLNSDFSPALIRILEGCLAKQRENRYERLDLLFNDLKSIYESHTGESLLEVRATEFAAVDYNDRGGTFLSLGRKERAIADFDEAIRLDPTLAQAYNNRAISYDNLGQEERAITDLDEAIRLDPTYAKAYNNRAIIYGSQGQHERAIADFDEAIRLDPMLAAAYVNRGNRYIALGQHERAIADFDEVIHLENADFSVRCDRGNSYAALGQDEQAITDFDEAIRLDPANVSAYVNRGNNYAALGQHEQAITDFDEAIRLDPANVAAYVNRGNRYDTLKQEERAIANYDEAIRRDPSFAPAYLNKGATLAGIGRWREALPLFEKAYELGDQSAIGAIQRARQELYMPLMQPRPNELEQAVRRLISIYQQIGESGIREVLVQQGIPNAQIDQIIAIAKKEVGGS